MSELLLSGVELMIVGMGIVFLFLAMLVVAVNIMSSLVARFLPTPLPVASPVPRVTQSDTTDPSIIAAISSAVHQYRSKNPR